MPFHKYEQNEFVWGPGCVSRLSDILHDHNVERVMIVCGYNVGDNETLMSTITEAIDGQLVETYRGARTNAPLETVFEGIERKQAANADGLISVGGGSAVDTAKAISVLEAEPDRELRELTSRTADGGEEYVPDLLAPKDPVFSVATTLSAAEVTHGFGVTDKNIGEKVVIVDEKIRPKVCVYDPELAMTTPSSVIANTGMAALDHTVEILYSESRADNPFYRSTAKEALQLLIENLPQAVNGDGDIKALEATLIGAAMSGLGAVGGIGINHGINHALCARHPVSHGDGNSILLPHGIQFNFESVPRRIIDIGDAMGIDTDPKHPSKIRNLVVERIRELQREINVAHRLRDFNVDPDDFERIAEIAVQDHAMATNPRPVSKSDIIEVLEAAW